MDSRFAGRVAAKLAGLLWVLLLAGCIIPFPHKRLHAYGVTGQVVDWVSGKPIRAAKIEALDGWNQQAFADLNGFYALKPIYGWHEAYYFGPGGVSQIPAFNEAEPLRWISISAPGYKRALVLLKGKPVSRDYIEAGTTAIQGE